MPGTRPSARQGLGLPSAQSLLIALKLAGVIGWPWWEVLLPTWFGLCALFLAASYALSVTLADRLSDRRADRAERHTLKRRPPHLPRHNTPTPR